MVYLLLSLFGLQTPHSGDGKFGSFLKGGGGEKIGEEKDQMKCPKTTIHSTYLIPIAMHTLSDFKQGPFSSLSLNFMFKWGYRITSSLESSGKVHILPVVSNGKVPIFTTSAITLFPLWLKQTTDQLKRKIKLFWRKSANASIVMDFVTCVCSASSRHYWTWQKCSPLPCDLGITQNCYLP